MAKKTTTKKAAGKLSAGDKFISRELSWLEFNGRVLSLGLDESLPLLERLKFMAIVSSNHDEFFMVRVGGLKQLVAIGKRPRDVAGLTPKQQLTEISRRAHDMVAQQYACLKNEILPGLGKHGIIRVQPETLTGHPARQVETYFTDEVFPSVTPIAIEETGLPRIANLTLHLAVRLHDLKNPDEERLAIVPMPRNYPRFFQVPSRDGYHFVCLEDLVAHYVGEFFPGYEVLETCGFRLTRNADLPVQEDEANDLIEAMEDVLRGRMAGSPVRLEVELCASSGLVRMLTETLSINERFDLYTIDGPLDLKPWMGLAGQVDVLEARYPSHTPQPVPEFTKAENVWEVIRERDVLLHHPYDSFEPVVRVLREAAEDPQVVSIKQTLYRTSSNSPIIAMLERAALNGKQVTVLVEIKARFDEDQNIHWAQRLTEAGAQVIYGVLYLKTHAKALMIVRRESDGVRRYVHLSTGNYNDQTARVYEDVGLMTCEEGVGRDTANLFNAITGYSEMREWHRFAVAPVGLRDRFYELIDREISKSTPEHPGRIRAKINSLMDVGMCEKLYEASRAGVRVDLCVRGMCAVRPGIKRLSENIRVISIVGRYLEHSRIYHFHNAGEEEVYMSSADWMTRNLDRRVEILFPILAPGNVHRLVRVLDSAFSDNASTWELQPDGSYERLKPPSRRKAVSHQNSLMELASESHEMARRERIAEFQPRGPGRAPGL